MAINRTRCTKSCSRLISTFQPVPPLFGKQPFQKCSLHLPHVISNPEFNTIPDTQRVPLPRDVRLYCTDDMHWNAISLIKTSIDVVRRGVGDSDLIFSSLEMIITSVYALRSARDVLRMRPMCHPVFCDSAMYVFLRYYDHVYGKLSAARKGAYEKAHAIPRGKEFGRVRAEWKERAMRMTVRYHYENIILLVTRALLGDEDNRTYELGCRKLTGRLAYVLYDFDKLLLTIARHAIETFREGSVSRIFVQMHFARRFGTHQKHQKEINPENDYSCYLHLAAKNLAGSKGNTFMFLVQTRDDDTSRTLMVSVHAMPSSCRSGKKITGEMPVQVKAGTQGSPRAIKTIKKHRRRTSVFLPRNRDMSRARMIRLIVHHSCQ